MIESKNSPENCVTLEIIIPAIIKGLKMHVKAVDNYFYALKFVPDSKYV